MQNAAEIKMKNMMIKSRENQQWKKAVGAMAAVVAFGTFSMAALPGVAMNEMHDQLECGAAAHIHCAACYDENNSITCGQSEYIMHTHDENCYDDHDTLLCTLEEISEHKHTEQCYDGEDHLICTLPEIIRHMHTEACYDENNTLICELDQAYIMEQLRKDENDAVILDENGEPVTDIIVVPEHQHKETCFRADRQETDETAEESETITLSECENSLDAQRIETEEKLPESSEETVPMAGSIEAISEETAVNMDEQQEVLTEPMVCLDQTDYAESLNYQSEELELLLQCDKTAEIPTGTIITVVPVEAGGTVNYEIHLVYNGKMIEPKKEVILMMTFLKEDFHEAENMDITYVDEAEKENIAVEAFSRNAEGHPMIMFRTASF